jgi:hypothetical protein
MDSLWNYCTRHEILGSHGDWYEDGCLPVCCAAYFLKDNDSRFGNASYFRNQSDE